MTFLSKEKETTEYVDALSKAGLAPTTVINYLKNMARFLKFVKRDIGVNELTVDNFWNHYVFRQKLDHYQMVIQDLMKPVSKDIARRNCKRRYVLYVCVYTVYIIDGLLSEILATISRDSRHVTKTKSPLTSKKNSQKRNPGFMSFSPVCTVGDV